MRWVLTFLICIGVGVVVADINWSYDPYGQSMAQQGQNTLYVDGNGQQQVGVLSHRDGRRAPATKATFPSATALTEQLKTWGAEPMNPPSSMRYIPSTASDFGVEIYHVTGGWVRVQGIGAYSVVEAKKGDVSSSSLVLCRLAFNRRSTPSVQQANQAMSRRSKKVAIESTPAPEHFSFYSKSSDSQRVVEATVTAYVQEQQTVAAELVRNNQAMDVAEKSGNTTLVGILFLERKRLKEKQDKKYTLPNVLNTDLIVVEDCIEVPYGYVRLAANVYYITRPLVNIESSPSFVRAAVYSNALEDGGWTAKQQALLDSVLPQPPAGGIPPQPQLQQQLQQPPYTPDPLDRFDADAAAARNGYGYVTAPRASRSGSVPSASVLVVRD